MWPYTTSRRISTLTVLFFGILVVSTASVFIRIAQQEVSSIVIAAYRLSIATIILLPIAWLGHRDEILHLKRKQVGLIIVSGLFLAVHFAAWISSLEFTSVASSVVLVTTTPLWVALLSPVFIRESPNWWVGVGMLVALVGGVLVGLSDTCTINPVGVICPAFSDFLEGNAFTGDLLALAGALAAAAYILIGRWLRPSLSLVTYITCVYGVAALALVILAAGSGQELLGFSFPAYLVLIALAVGPQLLGHTAFNYGLRYLSASYVSVALLGEPIGSTILALIFLKETPTSLELMGGVVILTGIYLATRGQSGAIPSSDPGGEM